MADLQKIVKLTQAQYTTLASGGTVGSYTGLNDNYVYLVENNTEYIPTTGGSIIDGGGLSFYDSNDDIRFSFGVNNNNNEIIYMPNGSSLPLFSNDDYAMIYSANDNYLSDFTFYTKSLRVEDGDDTGNCIVIDAEQNMIYNNSYDFNLPSASGTLALTSDIPSLTNYVTTNTNQDITGKKTIKDTSLDFAKTGADGTASWQLEEDAYAQLTISRTYNNTKTKMWNFNGRDLIPETTEVANLGSSSKFISTAYVNIINGNSNILFKTGSGNRFLFDNTAITPYVGQSLGTSSYKFGDIWTSGSLKDGTNSIAVADIQEKVEIKRFI